ncbi:MAG TPA: hypothetical protein VLH08_03395, partial [Acidobacteriota bacterium]|nr:hypothetical protein [Acidobacteriota bacterium]
MPSTADVSSGCSLSAFIGFLIQGLFIWFVVILISKRRKRRATSSESISGIARQWPADEEYLTKLCTPILAVPFTEGGYTCYATSIKQRKVSLRYFHDLNPKVFQISFAVTQKFWLRIIPQTGDDLPDEVRVQDQLLDAKFRIHSDKQQLAHRFFNSPIVVKELKDLHPFNSFEINKGKATYLLHNPRDTGFLHHAFQQTLSRLSNIIEIYEQQKLDLFIEVLQTESSICPYCREDLDALQERIV